MFGRLSHLLNGDNCGSGKESCHVQEKNVSFSFRRGGLYVVECNFSRRRVIYSFVKAFFIS